ncbi:SlyX family protein [Acinetobacter qingfengensis]|uniref:SlyX protein n=1 Tax=Acinetobacter qingfengensis TaxID=1262585 RepID=A0A1E7R1E1_9GAMM|nr:SlyX family protein [Acinetobacter qingfengensis]KAA8733249.1 SlyX family protein [Acinetobacter qingfengensis]OEY93118.1 SlyX protein [Acinetobacter qingfengensis]
MSKVPSTDDYATLCKLIEDLQVRITFLDDLVEQLNDQVAQQSSEILDLHKKMQILYQRVEASDLSDGIAPFDPLTNKPPHY